MQSGIPDPWRPDFTLPDPRNAGWIYAGTSAGAGGQLFLSHDWGSTWTQLSTPPFIGSGGPGAIQSLLPDPDVAGTLYALSINMFNLSADGGTSWQNLSTTSFTGKLTALSRSCAGGALLAGNQVSLDFGQTWHAIPILQMANVVAGPGCALYAIRSPSTDAFVAKLAPGGGSVLWSTYLGGSAADSAAAISVDNVGNVYVSGSTASPDFPITAPRIGTQGTSNVFLTQYNPNGTLLNSLVIGGEATDTVTAMSVTPRGDAFLAGVTNSTSFPVTSGALSFPPDPATNGWPGFAVRILFPSGVVYSANLRGIVQHPGTPVAAAAEASSTALFGGLDGKLYRMSADGSSLTSVAQEPGAIYTMDTDSEGNVFVASVDSQSAAVESSICSPGVLTGSVPPGDMIIAKLHTASLSPIFATRVAGQCQALPQAMKVGPDDTVTISANTLGQFPTLNPVIAVAPNIVIYQSPSSVIVQLDPNGALTYATYFNSATAIATAPDHSIYASASGANGASVLRLEVAPTSNPIVVTGAFNAFSGVPGTPTPGMLLTITGQNLAASWIDLGLNDPDLLPTQLGGVQVLFDGVPGQIMQIAPDHIICVVPWQLAATDRVTIQVINVSSKSTLLVLPGTYGFSGFGLLTQAFPALRGAVSVDGNIRNADGTLNGPDNPAAARSTVTLFATGVSAAGLLQLLWNAPAPKRFEILSPYLVSATVRKIGQGFVDALWAIDFPVPDYLIPGAPNAPGVTRNFIGRVGTGVGLYVK